MGELGRPGAVAPAEVEARACWKWEILLPAAERSEVGAEAAGRAKEADVLVERRT